MKVSHRVDSLPAIYWNIFCSTFLKNSQKYREEFMERIEKSIDVECPISTVYNQWTQFEDFPRFMKGVKKVIRLDDQRPHWEAKIGLITGPLTMTLPVSAPMRWRGQTRLCDALDRALNVSLNGVDSIHLCKDWTGNRERAWPACFVNTIRAASSILQCWDY
jgi:hypothetical protein